MITKKEGYLLKETKEFLHFQWCNEEGNPEEVIRKVKRRELRQEKILLKT